MNNLNPTRKLERETLLRCFWLKRWKTKHIMQSRHFPKRLPIAKIKENNA